jgi:glycosyltransferase involved in cell wall biosynthesis
LFNSIFLLPKTTKTFVHYHNITPEELVAREEYKPNVRRALIQRGNLSRADRILAVSDFNRQDLIEYGISPAKIGLLPLPLTDGFPPERSPTRPRNGPVEIMFVGRFVPAKGVLDLVEAIGLAARSGPCEFRLNLVGDLTYSDPEYLRRIQDHIAAHRLGKVVEFVGPVSQEALVQRYLQTDILAVPSYHEGYCLPVIEGLSCGCVPVTYDAGNLPNIVAGLGRVGPTGDRCALARNLLEVGCGLRDTGGAEKLRVDAGEMSLSEFWRRSRDYVSAFTLPRFAERLCAEVLS